MIQVAKKETGTKPELLAPGGSLDKCRVAFLYGADAVYASGKDFGLRGFAHNLDTEELAAATYAAHRIGKKIYVTVNVFARQSDIRKLPEFLEYLQELKVDALIISDPGVLLLARKYAHSLPLHLSTQANTTNSSSVEFWLDQGIRRINLARELNFREIAEIAGNSKAEIEVFVHGAMCMSYSGRCLMSAFLNNRSANSGFCTQPCRWSYGLVEEKRPGQFFPVQEDSRGTYVFNSKDLCLMEDIGRLASVGIDAFKIEGRMKGVLYLACVARAYRQAVDRCTERQNAFEPEPRWIADLEKVSHRPYTKGFLSEEPESRASNVETEVAYIQTHTLAGIVRPVAREAADEVAAAGSGGKILLEARSRLVPGQRLEFLYPDGSSHLHVLATFEDMNGNILPEAHPNRWIRFSVDFPSFPLQVVRLDKNRVCTRS